MGLVQAVPRRRGDRQAGAPQPIVSKLHEEIVKAVQTPAVRERIVALLLEPVTNTPDEFCVLIETEAAIWFKLIKDVGIRTE